MGAGMELLLRWWNNFGSDWMNRLRSSSTSMYKYQLFHVFRLSIARAAPSQCAGCPVSVSIKPPPHQCTNN